MLRTIDWTILIHSAASGGGDSAMVGRSVGVTSAQSSISGRTGRRPLLPDNVTPMERPTSPHKILEVSGHNPLPASSAPPSQVISTAPAAVNAPPPSGDLDLFNDQTTKSEDVPKKPLSKDSILSLYGTSNMQQQTTAGMFMGSSPMPYSTQPATNFQAFPQMGVAVPPTAGIMGNLMGQVMPAVGQNSGMMVGMGIPNGFVGNSGVMGLAPNMMGPQPVVGNMVPPQNKFGMQQNQPSPWNVSQMNQQMGAMNLNGASNMMAFGQAANTVGAGWSANSAGQTLSTQLWK